MVAIVVRMLVSLAVVLALMYVAARLLNRTRGGFRPAASRRRPTGGGRATRTRKPALRSAELEIVGHRPLGKGASVALVRAAERTWLLGVTETSVRLLSELDTETGHGQDATPDDAGFAAVTHLVPMVSAPVSLLDQLRERTVRRA